MLFRSAVAGGAHFKLKALFGELAHHPVDLGFALGGGRVVEVEIQQQGLPARSSQTSPWSPFVSSALASSMGRRTARPPAGRLGLAIPLWVVGFKPAHVSSRESKMPVGTRLIAARPARLRDHLAVFLPLDGHADGMAQLAAAFALGRRVAMAELRVQHVGKDAEDGRRDACRSVALQA